MDAALFSVSQPGLRSAFHSWSCPWRSSRSRGSWLCTDGGRTTLGWAAFPAVWGGFWGTRAVPGAPAKVRSGIACLRNSGRGKRC